MDHAYVPELASRLSIRGCIGICIGLFPSKRFSQKVLQTDIGKEIQTVYTDTVNQSNVFLQLGTLGLVMPAFVYKLSTECVFPLREHDISSAMFIGIPLGVLTGALLSLEEGRRKYNNDRQLGSNQPSDRTVGNNEDIGRGTDGNILVNIGKSPSSLVDNNEDIAGGAEGARRGDDLINGIGTSQNTIENNPDTSDDRERGQDTPGRRKENVQPPGRTVGNDEDTARGPEGNIPLKIDQSSSSIADNNEDTARGAEGDRRGDDSVNGLGTTQNTIENNPDTSDDRERGQDTPGRRKYNDDRQLGSNQPFDRTVCNYEDTARWPESNIPVEIGQSSSSIDDNNEDTARGAEGVQRGDDSVNGLGTTQNTIENNPNTSDDRERGQDTPDDTRNTFNGNAAMSLEDNEQVNNLDADHDSGKIDICVLHGTTDTDKAREFSKYLKHTIGQNLKIEIQYDFENIGESKFKVIGRFFKEARYLFVYISEEILKDNFVNFLKETALYNCLKENKYSNRIIPVWTTEKREDIFAVYNGISYYDKKCKDISKILKLIKEGRETIKFP